MAKIEISNSPIGEIRAATTAAGGTALTTTAACVQLPKQTDRVLGTFRNFAGATVGKLSLNPWLYVLKSDDGMITVPEDHSWDMQDASTSTTLVLNDFDTLANGDMLLIGSHIPFRGVAVDVANTNGGAASVLTVTYWNGAGWVTTSATDGTTSGGVTFAVDGLVTWTVPTPWKPARLSAIYKDVDATYPAKEELLYWTRWVTDVVFDSTVTVASMLSLNRSTAYSEWLSGQTFEIDVKTGPSGLGCIEALTDAGTANIILNAATEESGRFV